MNIKGIELCFLKIELEKALYFSMKFRYPKGFVGMMDAVELDIGMKVVKPSMNDVFVVDLGTGLVYGKTVKVVNIVAIVFRCEA